MKYLRITLAVFALLTLLLASACTGDGTRVVETFDFDGTDPRELLETWENMGEDAYDLDFCLPEVDGEYIPLIEWHITEIAEGNYDEYTIDLDEGNYTLWGIGGGRVSVRAVSESAYLIIIWGEFTAKSGYLPRREQLLRGYYSTPLQRCYQTNGNPSTPGMKR